MGSLVCLVRCWPHILPSGNTLSDLSPSFFLLHYAFTLKASSFRGYNSSTILLPPCPFKSVTPPLPFGRKSFLRPSPKRCFLFAADSRFSPPFILRFISPFSPLRLGFTFRSFLLPQISHSSSNPRFLPFPTDDKGVPLLFDSLLSPFPCAQTIPDHPFPLRRGSVTHLPSKRFHLSRADSPSQFPPAVRAPRVPFGPLSAIPTTRCHGNSLHRSRHFGARHPSPFL